MCCLHTADCRTSKFEFPFDIFYIYKLRCVPPEQQGNFSNSHYKLKNLGKNNI